MPVYHDLKPRLELVCWCNTEGQGIFSHQVELCFIRFNVIQDM